MAFKFDYGQKLDALEEFVETKTTGRFSGVWFLVLALLRSRYLLISLCFYFVLLLILGGVVVSHYVVTKGTFEEGQVLVLPSGPPRPPSRAPRQPSAVQNAAKQTRSVSVSVQSMTKSAARAAARRFTVSAPSTFVRVEAPVIAPQVQPADVKVETQMAKNIEAANITRLQNVRDFQSGWNVSMGGGGRSGGGGSGGGGSGGGGGGGGRGGKYHGIQAEFTIYQTKYQDGDWNCNGGNDTNYWAQSALKNFMIQVKIWSRGGIKANIIPKVLDIGTDDIFTLHPPFLYLTGHKDFHFLDREVDNLRNYLTLGGCIWADSALAGRRSRFDVAFRREIKRVIPDREFEIVKPDHEMFNTWFANVNIPEGINFYHEPLEMINIGDELAVLYTLNGYGHFWETRINSQNKIIWERVNLGRPGDPRWAWVHGPHLNPPRAETGVLFRNIDDASVTEAYRFGINVLVHLLTRYEDKLKFLPKELPKINPLKKSTKKEEEDELLPEEKIGRTTTVNTSTDQSRSKPAAKTKKSKSKSKTKTGSKDNDKDE